MIDAVIIGQNEGASVLNMYNALKQYKNINRIWVADRCDDDTVAILDGLGEFFVRTPDTLTGRCTSYCRNLGTRLTNPENDILYLDGDRYPINGSLEPMFNSTDDVTLMMLEHDIRENIDNTFWKQHMYGYVCNMFFSCGILMKRNAVEKLKEFQNGQVFDEDMQSLWGVEDTYLGDVCYHLGLTAGIYKEAKLNGGFDQQYYTDFEPLKMRFKKRDLLKVEW